MTETMNVNMEPHSTLYPWQEQTWQQLTQLRNRQQLPHAILLRGPAGIGKTILAERFAQALLCETPAIGDHACGQCSSCNWFAQYNHPDYRRVRPEILEEESLAESDDAGDTNDDKKAAKEGAKASKAPSKEIKIDQVRALSDFLNISTHRQGMRVVVLYPAEALNIAASNALLKTLEEPPPQTIFLLVSNNPDRLLPTILSRCRQFALAMPSENEALQWLTAQNVKDAGLWLAEQGGAPLAAYALAQTQTDLRNATDDFLRQLVQPSIEGALHTAERLQKIPAPDLVACMQRWLYDMFSFKLSGKIRYYPRYKKELTASAAKAHLGELLRLLKTTNERRMIAEHPLSAKLFIEDMLLDYLTLFLENPR